jgi:hypothetical protein
MDPATGRASHRNVGLAIVGRLVKPNLYLHGFRGTSIDNRSHEQAHPFRVNSPRLYEFPGTVGILLGLTVRLIRSLRNFPETSGSTIAETASRDEDEIREKIKELGLVEQPGKRRRVVLSEQILPRRD